MNNSNSSLDRRFICELLDALISQAISDIETFIKYSSYKNLASLSKAPSRSNSGIMFWNPQNILDAFELFIDSKSTFNDKDSIWSLIASTLKISVSDIASNLDQKLKKKYNCTTRPGISFFTDVQTNEGYDMSKQQKAIFEKVANMTHDGNLTWERSMTDTGCYPVCLDEDERREHINTYVAEILKDNNSIGFTVSCYELPPNKTSKRPRNYRDYYLKVVYKNNIGTALEDTQSEVIRGASKIWKAIETNEDNPETNLLAQVALVLENYGTTDSE